MKRPPPPPPPLPPPPSYASSSSSSSSCINSPKTQKRSLPKRVSRTKKIQNADGDFAASAKSRSSIFRGVTRHRWTGRFEAHLWDKSTWNSLQNKKGRQIYLGAYDKEESAARTYDLAALKYWGPGTPLNFPIEKYSTEIEEMKKLSKEEYLASLRRRSSGFSRGVSKYRGVARHHHNGRWEARIGRVSGNKYLYLGTYSTQEEAAAAYDMAAIEFRGPNAVTNFDISNYMDKSKTFLPETEIKQEDVQEMNQETLQLVPETHSDETIDNQDDQMVEPSVPKLELIDSITEDIEHPWNDLCLGLDLGGFNSFQIPNIPLDRPNELMGLFDDKGFDDEIDFIFDNELLQDAMSGTTAECKDVEENILMTTREEKASLTMTSSSPPSTSTSTSTSVGSNT